MKKPTTISIIIPVYNEEKTVAKLLKRISQVNFRNIQTEIIIVDDGSIDNTSNEVKKVLPSIKNAKFLKFIDLQPSFPFFITQLLIALFLSLLTLPARTSDSALRLLCNGK